MEINKNPININSNHDIRRKSQGSKTDLQPREQKDFVNSKNPAEYIGRSQVVFRGRKPKVSNPSLPKIPKENLKPLTLVETPMLSPEECKQALKEFCFTDDEIAQIDFNDNKNRDKASCLKTYYSLEFYQDEKENILQDMKSKSSEERLELFNEITTDTAKYINQENINNFKDYFELDGNNIYEFFDIFSDKENKDLYLKTIPLIKYIKGSCDVQDLRNLRYNSGLKDITYELADVLRQVNNVLPEEKRLPLIQCTNLGKIEDLTQEKVDSYITQLQKLSKNDSINLATFLPNYANKTLPELASTMENLDKVLTKYPINFEATNSFSIDDLEKITSRNDIKDVQEYMNSLSKDAKYMGFRQLPEETSTLDKSKMARLCNLVFDKDFGTINQERLFEFIDKQKEVDYKNFDELTDYIETFKGTDDLNVSDPEAYLTIGNGDYKSAITSKKLLQEINNKRLNFNTNDFYEILRDPETNFDDFNKILKFVSDNDIYYYSIPKVWYSKPKGYNKIYMKQQLGNKLTDSQRNEMYKFAETLNTQDELDYSVDLFNQHRYIGSSDKRFHSGFDEIKDIMKLYQEDKDLTKYIVELSRDEDNNDNKLEKNWRFPRKSSIIPAIEAYKIDKDLAKFFTDLKTSKDNYRLYEGDEIKSAVESALIDKDYTLELLNIKDENDDRGAYRFSALDVKSLVECSKIDPEFTKEILNLKANVQNYPEATEYRFKRGGDFKFFVQKAQEDKDFTKSILSQTWKDYDGNEYFRFSNDLAKEILESPKENKKFLTDVLNKKFTSWGVERYKYSPYEIAILVKSAKLDKNLTESLLNETYKHRKEELVRFPEAQKVLNVVEASIKDKKFTKELLKETLLDYYDEPYPRFNDCDILKLVTLSEKYGKKQVKDFLDMKTIDYGKKKSVNPRFDTSDIESLLILSETNKDTVDKLLPKTTLCVDGVERPKYGSHCIRYIVEAKKIDNDYAETLVDRNDKIAPSLTLSGSSIYTLTNAMQKNKDFTNRLLNLQYIDENNEKAYRFDADAINRLVEIMPDKEGEDYIIELANMTEQTRKGHKRYRFQASEIASLVESAKIDKEFTNELLNIRFINKNGAEENYSANGIHYVLENITYDDYKEVKSKIGDTITRLGSNDLVMAVQFKDLYKVTNLNEVKLELKKHILKALVQSNADLFGISSELKEHYPIIPTNVDEYCELLPNLVRSIGIEANELKDEQVKNFNNDITNLSKTLSKLSDKEFNNLEIKQEYSKNDFIKDVLKKLDKANLDIKEKQKVFDYYGFELHENEKSSNEKFPDNTTGYTIVGYPVNLNNGKKLAQIKDEKTKAVVEDLRPDVIRFSENNKIISNNQEIETLMNSIVEVFPEIRASINKAQHKTHDYDVFKHSLKVMQKISQNPEFQELNNSDKKVMLLASLLHDVTKFEGISDGTHPHESAFDANFITKKLKLTRDEQIKLYTLIDKHEWLGFVNNSKIDEKERTTRMQSVAFDLQQGNLFDMAYIFTQADISSIKKDDDEKIKSWKTAGETYKQTIKEYISELKKSQPLLPITKMPKASTIDKAITQVNSDGSTNIKGVYKTPDGLVVVKFNEVEDWEKIGFPKGSTSKGIMAKAIDNINHEQVETEVETGNIKFFVHGLDYPNQLAKFEAFALPNSDALLSVSYAERPETKYRFFRPQGIILDADSDYVYGGGNTDSGSGCGKDINEFKRNYTFGGHRESDRKYISELIKEETGMTDDEYIKFFEANKNKQITEIEPKDLQEKIIKKLATINSNHRKGNRAYNEMYLSNPKGIMGVFAYEMHEAENKGKHPLDFLKDNTDRTKFLQNYALNNDVPFYVFGD